MNRVTLLGNVTNDPDLRFTPGGAAVLSFGLATNRRYKSGDEWKDEATFHNIVVWRNAESLAKRVKKGTRIIIEGRLQTRTWETDGKKNYKTEIVADNVILVARYEGEGMSNADMGGGESSPKKSKGKSSESVEAEDIDPNDLPF